MEIDLKIKTYLDRLAASSKRPNSFLFFGAGEGEKFEAAMYFISKLAGKAGDGEFLRRVGEKNHPDVVILEPEAVEDKKGRTREKNISIEQIRKARERLKFFPFELERKFCLIKKAERINAEAGNALLKILEEPTESTFFVLLASGVESVLPTISSRCAILRFVETELPGWKEENREKFRNIFKEEIHERLDYAGEISKDKIGMIETLNDWEAVAAEGLRKLMTGGENSAKIRKVVGLIGSIREAVNQLEKTNASSKAVGENLMLNLDS
jgi:DNA polymerase III delta prime subunit